MYHPSGYQLPPAPPQYDVYGGYELPPASEDEDESAYHHMGHVAQDSYEAPPEVQPYHQQSWGGAASPASFGIPPGMPSYYYPGDGQHSYAASPEIFSYGGGGGVSQQMEDMDLERTSPPTLQLLHNVRTEADEEGHQMASGSSTSRVRSRRGSEEGATRRPQTARVRRPRRGVGQEEGTAATLPPSSSRASKSRVNTYMDPDEKSDFRKWLSREWELREMDVTMHPQILAQQVAEIKINFPELAIRTGRDSSDWVKGAKAGDEWYLYDYREWAEAYRQRINNLKPIFQNQYGRAPEGPQFEKMLLEEYKDVTPTHYAQLADPEKEAQEVMIARTIWDTFNRSRLQPRLNNNPDEELSPQMIAEESWNYSAPKYNNARAIMYLNKYLRNVLGWRPNDLFNLEDLQHKERARLAPLTTRGKRRTRRLRR